MSRIFILVLVSSVVWACGGRVTPITTTVALPSSASGSLSAVGIKDLTAEAAQSGLRVKAYDGDTLLGAAVTDRDGVAIIHAVELGDGDRTLFFIVEDEDGREIAGASGHFAISSDTALEQAVDSTEDFAYRAFLASCEKKLGAACRPGANINQGSGLVVPRCVGEVMAAMVQDIDDTSVGGRFGALLEAHRQNIASGGAVSLKDVLKGDASARVAFGSAFGRIGSVAVSDAALTAAIVLDHVVGALCGDTATDALSVSSQADHALLAHLLSPISPTDVGSIVDSTLRSVFVGLLDVGSGPEFFRNSPPAALAMMEALLQGGFADIADATEIKKRIAVIIGSGVPQDATEARRAARAAINIFGATHFVSASLEHALSDFGPLLGDDDQMMNFIIGGSQALDNIVDRFGSLDDFHTNFLAAGGVTAFLAAYPQRREIGASCAAVYDCLSPLNCSAGLCDGVIGLGDACSSNSDCDAMNNLVCNQRMGICVYAFGQAGLFDFGDFAEATAGEERGRCLTGRMCSNELRFACLQGMCRPVNSNSEFCSDGRCIGAENTTNCPADCGTVEAENYCGDGTCNGSEVRRTCPRDCPMPLRFAFAASTYTDDCAKTNPTFSAGAPAVDVTFTTSSQGSATWSGTAGQVQNATASLVNGAWTLRANQDNATVNVPGGTCTFSRRATFTVSTDPTFSTCTWSFRRAKVAGNCGSVIGGLGIAFCTQTATNAACTIP